MVMTVDSPVLLTGDAAYIEANWRYLARPFLAHDMDRWWVVAWRIKKFAQLVPLAVVIPGHDTAAVERSAHAAVTLHEFRPDASGSDTSG
jgi:glyoxylase-like metal-dependent hydrolase (beta-lactamase superfamily II)